jgi:galactose mutarotase-like enzyme
MFSINRFEKVFVEYEIKDASTGSSFTIIPEWGGLVSEFIVNDFPILYLDKEILKKDAVIRAGGIPILFPICAGLKNGFAMDGERKLEVPRHGFARTLPWEVIETREGQEGIVTIGLQSGEYTRSVFPYEFNLKYRYILNDDELQIKHTITNTGSVSMPYFAGFHPFFSIKNKSTLKFNIPADTYDDGIAGIEKQYNGVIDLNKPTDFIFNLNDNPGHIYEMVDKEAGRKISLRTSQAYKYMILWTVEGKDYVCVEPWMGKPFALNTGVGLERLKPGEKSEEFFAIKVSMLK